MQFIDDPDADPLNKLAKLRDMFNAFDQHIRLVYVNQYFAGITQARDLIDRRIPAIHVLLDDIEKRLTVLSRTL